MNQRATEYDLNDAQFEQLIDKYITTIVDSMSLEDFLGSVASIDLQYVTASRMPQLNKSADLPTL